MMYKILISEANINFSDMMYEWQLVKETRICHILLSRGYSPTMDAAYKEAKEEYNKCKDNNMEVKYVK